MNKCDFVVLACVFIALSVIVVLAGTYKTDAAHPVACADIPESNERIVIVRDGQVECHYKITKVKEKK